MRNKYFLWLFLISFLPPLNLYPGMKRGQASVVINDVKVKREISRFRKVYRKSLFRSGDIISTGSKSYLEIILFNQKRIRVYQNSLIKIKSINKNYISISLSWGSLSIFPLVENESPKAFLCYVNTPITKITTQSNDEYIHIAVLPEPGEDKIVLVKGIIFLESRKPPVESMFLQDGNRMTISSHSGLDEADLRLLVPNDLPRKEDRLILSSSPLSEFDPNLLVVSNRKDPFFTEIPNTEEYRETIRHYRKRKKFYFNFELGSQYISDRFYFSLGLYPQLKLKRFKVRLRLLGYAPYSKPDNPKSWFNYSEWDFKDKNDILEDSFSKIDYIHFKDKKENIHVSLQELDNITLGHGLAIQRFSNTLLKPYWRQLGLFYKFDYKSLVFEGFIAHLPRSKIFAFRIETLPFYSPNEKRFDEFKFGLTFEMDLEPNQKGGNPEIYIGSLDINIPLFNKVKEEIQLSLYSEVALQGYNFNSQQEADTYSATANKLTFVENSFGVLLGLRSHLAKIVTIKAEYRFLAKGFIAEYLDRFYEIRRKEKTSLLLAQNKSDFHGALFGFELKMKNTGQLYFEYYYESGSVSGLKKANNRLHFEIKTSPKLAPSFIFTFSYDHKGFNTAKELFKTPLANQSSLSLNIRYALSKHLDLVVNAHSFYIQTGSSYNNKKFLSLSTFFIF